MFWERLRRLKMKLSKNWARNLTAFATAAIAIQAFKINLRFIIIPCILIVLVLFVLAVPVYLFVKRVVITNAIRKAVAFIVEITKKYIAILRTISAIIVAIMSVLAFLTHNALLILPISMIAFLILFTPVYSLITGLFKRITSKSKVAISVSGRYVAIISTIIVIMTILIFSSIKDLPNVAIIEETAGKVGRSIAAKNMASLSSSMDNIIHAIINFQKDPDATRNRVYEDALKQAADKGYVFYIPQKNYYITALNKRNDEHLLTEEERNRIEKSLGEILKRTNKRDQISLMNMVLSDIRVTEELWMPKERLADLTPLDLIGVVGGYIGELILER